MRPASAYLIFCALATTCACSSSIDETVDYNSEKNQTRAAFGEAQKNRPLTEAERLKRAESSFSPVAFSVHDEEFASLGLTINDVGDCRLAHVCTWTDADGIEHDTNGDRRLATKTILIDTNLLGNVNALGISRTRSRSDVTRAVKRFLPGLTFDCSDTSIHEGGKTCSSSVGDGTIMLWFNDQDRLFRASIYAGRPL